LLRNALTAGRVAAGDLPELTWWPWAEVDSPTSAMSQDDWLTIFGTAGFFSWPSQIRNRRLRSLSIGGATAERVRLTSWTCDQKMAVHLGARHARYGPAALYQATVAPGAVLGYLRRQDEGRTILIDPAGLEDIKILATIPGVRSA
jgi:hypothetical protein